MLFASRRPQSGHQVTSSDLPDVVKVGETSLPLQVATGSLYAHGVMLLDVMVLITGGGIDGLPAPRSPTARKCHDTRDDADEKTQEEANPSVIVGLHVGRVVDNVRAETSVDVLDMDIVDQVLVNGVGPSVGEPRGSAHS